MAIDDDEAGHDAKAAEHTSVKWLLLLLFVCMLGSVFLGVRRGRATTRRV